MLVSTNHSYGRVRGTVLTGKLSVNDVKTIFVARRRASRYDTLHILTGHCNFGICSDLNALGTLETNGGLSPGASTSIVASRIMVNGVHIRQVSAPRSTTRDYYCHIATPSKGSTLVTASVNIVLPSIEATTRRDSFIILRSGRSVGVLGGKFCPCPLGREVLSGEKRLSGRTYTGRLIGLIRGKALELVLNRLDRRGGAIPLTVSASMSLLASGKVGCGDSCSLSITPDMDAAGTVVFWPWAGGEGVVGVGVVYVNGVGRGCFASTVTRCTGHLATFYGFGVVRLSRRHVGGGVPGESRVSRIVFSRKGQVVRGVSPSSCIITVYVRKGSVSDRRLSGLVSGTSMDKGDAISFVVNNDCKLSRSIGGQTSIHLSVDEVAFPRRVTEVVLDRRVCHTFRVSSGNGCRGWFARLL